MPITARRVDYDQIADLYDEPGRDFDPDGELLRYLEQRPIAVVGCRVLDMGCGTGKQLAADHQSMPSIQLVGLDLFYRMLEHGRQRCTTVGWVQGDNMSPPFAGGSFDYITNQF